ncbi:hypothetical protein BJX63DRAFT_387636 [Aspergillus granulosus]|uniref:Uncharacterized protein n=1 Tax=Aspergillus granulosus TaxID=176169 RepID=A0ABR4HM39_9EURO
MARQLLGFAAVAMCIFTGTLAQSIPEACSNSNSLSIPIRSQSDIYSLLNNGCTTLYGQLRIQSSFEGEFILPNVTSIKVDGITVENGTSSALTSIELPDLIEVSNSIALGTLERVRKVSMPKLKSIPGSLSGRVLSNNTDIELDALESVKNIDLVGNFTILKFPSLQAVNQTISICNVPNCDLEYTVPDSTMDISFPALKSADMFYIKGQASGIFAPNLTAIGMLPITTSGANITNTTSAANATNATTTSLETRDAFYGPQDVHQGLNLNLDGVPLNISFPSLVNVTAGVNLNGPFRSLSLPSMTTYPTNFTVYSTEPLDVNLPVVHAHNLIFEGSIESVKLTSLLRPFNLTVYSESVIMCDDIIVPGRPAQMPNVYCSDSYDSYTYTSYTEPGLSTVQKIIIAVVVIVVVALGVVAGFVLWRRRKAQRGLKTGLIWRPGSVWSRDSDTDSGLGKEMDVGIQSRGPPPPYPARPEGV